MTTEELHNFYTRPMEDKQPPLKLFLSSLIDVHIKVLAFSVTALFSAPILLLFAWILGILASWIWGSFMNGFSLF